MPISLIAAMAKNRVIGRDNQIPWKIPGEQKLFRRYTEGHTIVMGRKTYESIGRPLPMRTNVVLTRSKNFHPPGCEVINDFSIILENARKKDIFVIGGEKIFELFLPYTDSIYLSILQQEFEGDAFFPEFPEADYQISQEEEIEAVIPYRFVLYLRKQQGV